MLKFGLTKFSLGDICNLSENINFNAYLSCSTRGEANIYNKITYTANIEPHIVSVVNIFEKLELSNYIDYYTTLVTNTHEKIELNVNTDSHIVLTPVINSSTFFCMELMTNLAILIKKKQRKFSFMRFGLKNKIKNKVSFRETYIYDEIQFQMHLDKYIFPSLNICQRINYNLQVFKYIFPSLNIYQKVNYQLYVEKFNRLTIVLYEYLNTTLYIEKYIKLVILIVQIVHLDVTLNKGNILVLDSNNFNLTINDQNMLHLHRGDWITLDRNLVDFKMEAENGNKIDGKLVYNERFF